MKFVQAIYRVKKSVMIIHTKIGGVSLDDV